MKVPPIVPVNQAVTRSVIRAIFRAVILGLISLSFCSCNEQPGQQVAKRHKIVATRPQAKAVNVTHQYVCQIRARHHVKIHPHVKGYLNEILVTSGQTVKAGDLMFKVLPNHFQAKLDALTADATIAELELNDAQVENADKTASTPDIALRKARLDKAKAHLAVELEFTMVKAPFDGTIDRLLHSRGSLVEKGETLTTLSDNSLIRAYFNVPETRYLEYMTEMKKHKEDLKVELLLPNGDKFEQSGTIGAIDAGFNTQTGNIGFSADFPNPDGRLRHGQAGYALIHLVLRNALVIPQRATFEILDKRYVYVVDNEHVLHRREIDVEHELDDIFVIRKGLKLDDRIVLEGIRNVNDGEQVDEDAKEAD